MIVAPSVYCDIDDDDDDRIISEWYVDDDGDDTGYDDADSYENVNDGNHDFYDDDQFDDFDCENAGNDDDILC